MLSSDVWLTSRTSFTEAATDFAISLVQTLMVQEPPVVSELPNLIDGLAKVSVLFSTGCDPL